MRILLAALLACAYARTAKAGEAFTFAVLSDTHIGHGGDDAARRLKLAIDKVRSTDAEFVFITGDLTHSARPEQYAQVKALFDTFTIPYFPVLGNHDIWPYHENVEDKLPDGDLLFETTFGPVFRERASRFPGFLKQAGPVWDPERKVESYYQNYAFVHKGCGFVALDWISRRHAILGYPGAHAQADLHDFPDGTYRWAEELKSSGALAGAQRVFVFQHHPLRIRWGIPDFLFGFSHGEKGKLRKLFTGDWGVFAGHHHRAWKGDAFDEQPEVPVIGGLRQVETGASMSGSMVTLVRVAEDGKVTLRQF
ncbi:MAG: metallophosphoesterase [Elusimicrobia bacterium]|nr:metallophosphoesterase [Elusimicrobiota bacterium]